MVTLLLPMKRSTDFEGAGASNSFKLVGLLYLTSVHNCHLGLGDHMYPAKDQSPRSACLMRYFLTLTVSLNVLKPLPVYYGW